MQALSDRGKAATSSTRESYPRYNLSGLSRDPAAEIRGRQTRVNLTTRPPLYTSTDA